MIKRLDKRGEIPKAVFWIGGIILVGIILAGILNTTIFKDLSRDVDTSSTKPSEMNLAKDDGISKGVKYFDYVIGGIPKVLIDKTSEVAALIIVIALWLLIFVTFADILAAFSTFSKDVSWVVGFLISIIAANLNFIIYVSVFCVGIFAFLGTLAVFVGMAAAFIVFIAINWGIGSLGPFVLRRKAMRAAEESKIKAASGGTALAGVIKGLGEAGKELKKIK